MAQSTRPASANGSARQDTRAAGRPARSSADGAVRSLAGAKASSPGNGAAGRSRASLAHGAGSRRRHLVRRNLEPRASVGRGPGRRGGRRRISSMICGSTCAGCARCPTCCHGRQARAPCVARCARKWPGPCAAVAGARLGRLHDGSAAAALRCRSGYRSASLGAGPRPLRDRARRDVRQPADRTLPGHAAPAPGTQRGIPAAMAERAPRSLYRALGRRLEGWDAALRARLDNAADQGPRRQHAARIRVKRLRYASEALLLLSPSRKLERYVKALADVQGALGSAQDFRTAAALGRDVSACRPAGWRVDKATKRPCDCCAGPAMACAQPAGACCGRLSGRRPAADGGPTPRVRWRRSAARHRVTRHPLRRPREPPGLSALRAGPAPAPPASGDPAGTPSDLSLPGARLAGTARRPLPPCTRAAAAPSSKSRHPPRAAAPPAWRYARMGRYRPRGGSRAQFVAIAMQPAPEPPCGILRHHVARRGLADAQPAAILPRVGRLDAGRAMSKKAMLTLPVGANETRWCS